VISAVLWDLGGVILTSPFAAFSAYEVEVGLPEGFLRRLNGVDPDANAWARFERGELDEDAFVRTFEAEARALGGELSGGRVLAMVAGEVRPEMVTAVHRCRDAGLGTACLTNTFAGAFGGDAVENGRRTTIADVLAVFDVVVESYKVGVRKPEPRFYELACERLGVPPERCAMLDDLGINLKPAKAMGMATIKVGDPLVALDELGALLGIQLT
jgi:putative hydrolase of the HAD superfamily